MKPVRISILLVFLGLSLSAQIRFPEPGFVFDDDSVPVVHISIDQSHLDFILHPNNANSNEEFFAQFSFTRDGVIESVDSIGFRLRGNTSRSSNKKSFKVSFNSFIKGQKFFGLEKLNLNGEHNDPSISRAKFAWDLFNSAQVPSPRSNHVLLYINDIFYGIYVNVEHIDEEFVKSRFTEHDGNLYKCLFPADLKFKGLNPNLYKEEIFGRRAYDLKTNTDQDDYQDLANFIRVLNQTSDEDFMCEIEKVFDVDTYIKTMVIDILSANWDGYLNKNNFYLYHDPCSNQFTYIPYDVDNTFGIDWFGVDWANINIYSFYNTFSEDRPLMSRFIKNEEFVDRFSYFLDAFISEHFNIATIMPYLNNKRDLIKDFRLADTFANKDYSWDYDDFIKSFTSGLDQHAYIGILDYCGKRINAAKAQLQVNDVAPVLEYKNTYWSPDTIIIDGKIWAQAELSDVQIFYAKDGQNFISEEIELNSDFTFEFEFDLSGGATNLLYYIEIQDTNLQSSRYPNCDFYQEPIGHPLNQVKLVINEVMASNENVAPDEFGEFEDWIEIYNNEAFPIDVSDFYLSDEIDFPNKWKMPSLVIQPDDYLTIWCDDDPEQGPLHTNFKLKKEGEFIGLFSDKSDYYAPVDTLTLPALDTRRSYGRLPNGTGDFQLLDYFTFGYNNELPSSASNSNTTQSIFYPNPCTDVLHFDHDMSYSIKFRLLDINGEMVTQCQQCNSINVSNLIPGVYFAVAINDDQITTQKILIQ